MRSQPTLGATFLLVLSTAKTYYLNLPFAPPIRPTSLLLSLERPGEAITAPATEDEEVDLAAQESIDQLVAGLVDSSPGALAPAVLGAGQVDGGGGALRAQLSTAAARADREKSGSAAAGGEGGARATTKVLRAALGMSRCEGEEGTTFLVALSSDGANGEGALELSRERVGLVEVTVRGVEEGDSTSILPQSVTEPADSCRSSAPNPSPATARSLIPPAFLHSLLLGQCLASCLDTGRHSIQPLRRAQPARCPSARGRLE